MTAGGPGPVAGARRRLADRAAPAPVRAHRPAEVAGDLPVLVEPVRAGVDLAEYSRTHRDQVRRWLHHAGAVLFRGFGVTLDSFGAVARTLVGPPSTYQERSSPRTELADRIYTTTDHPPDQTIPLHNENSYQATFPGALAFACLVPATTGGQTPLADIRRVLARVPEPVRERFARRGVRYVRAFGGGLGLPWQEVFQTTSRDQVTAYCRARDIEVEWHPGGLRTSQVRPAIARHPVTGERAWFNHALFFNAYSLPAEIRDLLLRQVAPEDLPNHTSYGDGRPIPQTDLAAVAEAYAAEEVAVPWQTGDVLLVDNLLAAHGRRPFTGPRKVVVSMGSPLGWDQAGTAVRQPDKERKEQP